MRHILTRRDGYAEVERWFTDARGAGREVQLRGLSAASAQLIFAELLWRADRNETPMGDLPVYLDVVLTGITQDETPLPDLGVHVRPAVLAIDSAPDTAWTSETVTGLLCLLADITALARDSVDLVLVDELSESLPKRDQARFRSALPSHGADDVRT